MGELRQRIRRHPCHDCPDREEHARYAERYLRLGRETEALEHRVAGRSHVIARTFDRVCRVLERLSYLAGDTVTADGRRLGGLYTELDLLASECIRRGLWDGLSPAELAAAVSALTFESRQADDIHPPRLPKGRTPDVLAAMIRTWNELDQLEKDNDLSFLREPDLGFAWAAYRWARGARLEAVLDESPELTPGDFVRSVKQLIDLLDQIASAAPIAAAEPGPALSVTARAAIDAMRRGVIAYSAVADYAACLVPACLCPGPLPAPACSVPALGRRGRPLINIAYVFSSYIGIGVDGPLFANLGYRRCHAADQRR